MSKDPRITNFYKNVKTVLGNYDKAMAASGKEIAHAIKELKKLGVKDPLKDLRKLAKDKDKKKKFFAECIIKARKKADNAAASLQTNLTMLQVPPGIPESELKQFLTWLEKTIKERSVKLGKNVKIKLNLSFNKNYTKLEGAGLTLIWNF